MARNEENKMLYLIFGKDSFRIREKLNQIKEKFIEKTGFDLDVEVFDESAFLEQIKNAIESRGFFTIHKLLVFKDFVSQGNPQTQKDLAKLLDKIPDSIYLVFIEKEEKSKNPIWKKIKNKGKIWQFTPLNYYGTLDWIQKKTESKGGEIASDAIRTLAFFIGNDLWRLDSEIEKLITYKGRKKILIEDVEKLVKPEFSPGIFDLIDNIAIKNLSKSQIILKQLLDSGENPLYIHTMIVYQFRNLIKIKFLTSSGLKSFDIREKTRLHPFVVQKSLEQVENFSFESLKKIYSKLLDAEIAIKTGKIEPDLALELLVPALLG